MAGSVPADHHAKSEVLALIDKVSDLIGNDAYADAAREIAAFVNGRPGLRYFVEEAQPSRVSDHVLKKTGAHVRLPPTRCATPIGRPNSRRPAPILRPSSAS